MNATISIMAEKPSIARALVRAFSIVYKLKFKGQRGRSKYNYCYECSLEDQKISFKILNDDYKLRKGDRIIISSVTGHILNFDYPPPYDKNTNWHNTDPIEIVELKPIEVPIHEDIVEHVREIGRKSDVIIIGTDWDGHGESIGRQILDLATQENPKIRHGRMRFTSTNPLALTKAFENQSILNWDWINQVDSLRKQDLRMGSTLTRFLTVGIQNRGIHNRIVSYGPCQTSVLWLITNRYLENRKFKPEIFWRISIKIKTVDGPLFLEWRDNPSLDEELVDSLIEKLTSKDVKGIIEEYNEQPGFIKRPIPLDTDTLEAECSQIFRISPKQVADIAEKLYNNGFITYPRTESSYYHEKDLTKLVSKFLQHDDFGSIASECIKLGGVSNPSKGRYSKDHEPIKPVKPASLSDIQKTFSKTPWVITNAWKIYNYVVLRFLASVHVDAKIVDQYIIMTALSEEFIAKGRKIVDEGFLKFYKSYPVEEKPLPSLKIGSKWLIEAYKHHGYTTPPPLWSESKLIRKMAELNLGTDATRSTHIDTVQKRQYTSVRGSRRVLVPTLLGQALYKVLCENAEELILPEIRGKVEEWTQQIKSHEKTPEDVDRLVINLTTNGLQKMKANEEEIFDTLVRNIKEMTGIGQILGTCPECEGNLVLQTGKEGSRFLKCSNPLCNLVLPLPKKGELTLLENQSCRICSSVPLLVSTKGINWIMCPICWTRKAQKDKPWFCSECNKEDCPFSGTWHPPEFRQLLGECPECGGKVFLYLDKDTKIQCEKCKKNWKTPKLRPGTTITPSIPCSKCGQNTMLIVKRGKKPFRLCVFCSLFFFTN
ncbi:MAG: DNA topoisomerase [Candidatus Hodarchaeales archaeon]